MDRTELTTELVEVESSLELWTLEGDQKRYIFFPWVEPVGSECFPSLPLRSCQVQLEAEAFQENDSGVLDGGAFHSVAQSRTCCQCILPLAPTPEGHCSLDGPGVLSICKRNDLAYLIHPSISVYMGALWTSPALWDQCPHCGAAYSSGASQPGSEHGQELRCASRTKQPPSCLTRLSSPTEPPQGWMEVGYLCLPPDYL